MQDTGGKKDYGRKSREKVDCPLRVSMAGGKCGFMVYFQAALFGALITTVSSCDRMSAAHLIAARMFFRVSFG